MLCSLTEVALIEDIQFMVWSPVSLVEPEAWIKKMEKKTARLAVESMDDGEIISELLDFYVFSVVIFSVCFLLRNCWLYTVQSGQVEFLVKVQYWKSHYIVNLQSNMKVSNGIETACLGNLSFSMSAKVWHFRFSIYFYLKCESRLLPIISSKSQNSHTGKYATWITIKSSP